VTPLEGVHDYVDLSLIVNPWQAMVATVAIFALLIWPQMSARQSVKRVEKSLTENNGGSSVKDRFDKLERLLNAHIEWSEGYVREQDERLDKLEEAKPEPRRRQLFRRSR
jgi:hypothetical protein